VHTSNMEQQPYHTSSTHTACMHAQPGVPTDSSRGLCFMLYNNSISTAPAACRITTKLCKHLNCGKRPLTQQPQHAMQHFQLPARAASRVLLLPRPDPRYAANRLHHRTAWGPLPASHIPLHSAYTGVRPRLCLCPNPGGPLDFPPRLFTSWT